MCICICVKTLSDASAASARPIRRKNVHYRMTMIPKRASRRSRQQSWPSTSRARRACPEGNRARSAESIQPGVCTFRYCKYRHLCATCRGNHSVVECPSKTKGRTRASPLCPMRRGGPLLTRAIFCMTGHATEATADRRTLLTTASTHSGYSKLVVRLYIVPYALQVHCFGGRADCYSRVGIHRTLQTPQTPWM